MWVRAGTARPEVICATAPRRFNPGDAEFDPADPAKGLTPLEREWRRFVMHVQYHGCREGMRPLPTLITVSSSPAAKPSHPTQDATGAVGSA